MLPNHNLMAKTNCWEYLQAISATWQTYQSTGTCCVAKKLRTCSSPRRRSIILADWTLFSRRPTLDVHTKSIPPTLCLRGWVLGWFHLVDPWGLLTWHWCSEPWTSEDFHHWSVCKHWTNRSLFQIYTIKN